MAVDVQLGSNLNAAPLNGKAVNTSAYNGTHQNSPESFDVCPYPLH